MASHPLRKYANHVRQAVVRAGLPRPNYTWCLRWVKTRWDEAKAKATSVPELKRLLAQAIVPVAKVQQDLEGRYIMPR